MNTLKEKWRSVSSWWYWNVSSKYDVLDLFIYTFYPLLIAAILWIALDEHKQRTTYSAVCEAKGGVVLKSDKKYICVDLKDILK